MNEFLFIFAVVAVIAVTAVVFAMWILVGAVRLVGRGVVAMFRPHRPRQPILFGTFSCPRRGCGAINPTSARFCRRCGQELLRGQLARRQAAMW